MRYMWELAGPCFFQWPLKHHCKLSIKCQVGSISCFTGRSVCCNDSALPFQLKRKLQTWGGTSLFESHYLQTMKLEFRIILTCTKYPSFGIFSNHWKMENEFFMYVLHKIRWWTWPGDHGWPTLLCRPGQYLACLHLRGTASTTSSAQQGQTPEGPSSSQPTGPGKSAY